MKVIHTLARDRLSAFQFFYLTDVVERFGKLNHGCVLRVHLEQVDQMRGARAIEDAFLDWKYRIAVRIAVEHRATHAAAGAGAGDKQTIDVLAHEISDQMCAKKGAGAGFAHDKF